MRLPNVLGVPSRNREAVRVAVLADSDTRWKWGALTARRISPPGSPVTGFVLRGRATPTTRQLAEVGADVAAPREVTGAEFLHAVLQDAYDVVVLALVGGTVQALLHGLAGMAPPRRPVVVTGYVGVVYEKLADGLLLRHGADVVLANSRHDARRFRAVYEGVGADASAVVEAALPFLGGARYAPAPDRDTVVFAAQPSVPAPRADRAYLLRRLVEHARLHPHREVLLKLRSRPGEHTTHVEEHPYQKLARGPLPPNLRLVHGHMGEVLDRTDLLVTVSSTAALEALHRGVPTAVLTDLGVREALGNHHFLGSGLLTSWDRLDGGHRPRPDARWLADQGVAADGSYATAFDAARARVLDLLAAPALPPIAPYYTPATAPGYLPGVLGRHRLDAGEPPATSPVRRVLRDAARGVYRHGVQRVAPVIRRLGEL
ncbi:hypothetical protein E2C00_26795 [Streptomyces sp. WAC05374]|uniref:DUF6716 putative glycosyltransferase n=1 Tax=Streptomyces sp. WAC05374 TaxID=2487420 RepID=UPI000F8807E9|nr:DUF6716 putative glycosyltransferase [Streptomyces sp. WAC05374]RST14181.1 hypothetical protein EF905_18120 [Streptomyces sp. WAC05374]TDF43137.1 hypothetical protein E2B92_19650 [Streptomyces sp. WAC05374]TDF50924.1 hypothetical protein E2C00_26795 [Streptomyces sp. WAC05374]TDF52333.1 hypothetical protein E2C02_22375 [Streptomyces sp. WAC05374]